MTDAEKVRYLLSVFRVVALTLEAVNKARKRGSDDPIDVWVKAEGVGEWRITERPSYVCNTLWVFIVESCARLFPDDPHAQEFIRKYEEKFPDMQPLRQARPM